VNSNEDFLIPHCFTGGKKTMDMSTLLPLLMNAKGGNKNNADNSGGKEGETSENKKGGLNPADLLSMMNNNGGKIDHTALLQNLMPNMQGGENGNIAQIMSLASAMNQGNNSGNNNRRNRPPAGIRPIKSFANNDVIGRLVKYFQ